MAFIHLTIILDIDVIIAGHIAILHVEERACGNAFSVRVVQHCASQVERMAVTAGPSGTGRSEHNSYMYMYCINTFLYSDLRIIICDGLLIRHLPILILTLGYPQHSLTLLLLTKLSSPAVTKF